MGFSCRGSNWEVSPRLYNMLTSRTGLAGHGLGQEGEEKKEQGRPLFLPPNADENTPPPRTRSCDFWPRDPAPKVPQATGPPLPGDVASAGQTSRLGGFFKLWRRIAGNIGDRDLRTPGTTNENGNVAGLPNEFGAELLRPSQSPNGISMAWLAWKGKVVRFEAGSHAGVLQSESLQLVVATWATKACPSRVTAAIATRT